MGMCIAGWYELHSVAAQTSCVSKREKRVLDPERKKKTQQCLPRGAVVCATALQTRLPVTHTQPQRCCSVCAELRHHASLHTGTRGSRRLEKTDLHSLFVFFCPSGNVKTRRK